MSFIIQRISGPRVILQEIRQATLAIGRGTTAQLRSENPSVALEHAVIEASPGGFDLVDRGSITGTYLNGRAVENARLGPGDVIEVGDILITVQVAQPGQPMFLRVETLLADGDAIEEVEVPLGTRELPMPIAPREALKAPRVDYAASYRLRRGLLSKAVFTLALTLVVLGGLAVVWWTGQNVVFRPGQVSVAHTQVVVEGARLIDDNNCVACHEPWGGAPDTKCQACHVQAGHRSGIPPMGSCGDCHAEHRQLRNLADVIERHCIDCHRDLRAKAKLDREPAVTDGVVDFGASHPEFRIVVGTGEAKSRVAVDSAEGRRADGNPLKFNHKCHLTGNCNKRPPTASNPNQEVEKLECASCHEIDAATGAMMAISYEKSCARCHPLTFDNRFPPVPHRLDLATVAGFIANAYSGNESILRMSADEVTRVFAQGRGQVNVASTIVRNAQRTLEARCRACHEFNADNTAVVPPLASQKWFVGVKVFDHRSHLNQSVKTACVDCHAGAATSEKTTDLSMPGIASCRSCHQASGEYAGSGIETCQTCHYFHELSLARGEGWTLTTAEIPKEMIEAATGEAGARGTKPTMFGLPFWAAISAPLALVILVGVAGVFVGAARNVASRPKIPALAAARRPEVAPRAPVATAAKREAKPSPAPPAPPPTVPESTVAIDLSEMERPVAAPQPGRTVAADYFGSIVFTSGVLAGRRYVIDQESGCYIGRDRNLADIVIEDNRISRRHVWVGVRGDAVVAVDQNSTNGSYLERTPATRITEARLEPGDVVILGEAAAAFRFEA
jgi:pSer/pThr/pTyr-binding forkhead associated (FHA) protein